MPRPARLPSPQHRFIDTGIVRIHVTELPASAPPLMLLHGIGMDWRVWQAVSRRMHPHFHLYLPDLRGHGESDKPPRGYSLADYAADVEDVIDRLRLQDVTLVGSSLGGMVAAVVEVPADVVSHRVLVDPPLTGGPIKDEEGFREILRLKHKPPRELGAYLGRSNRSLSPFLLKTMSEMWHEAADGVIVEMLEQPHDYYAIDQALRGDESPTLLMRADPKMGGVLSEEEAERAIALLPNGSQIEIAGAGHAIHAFKPNEFVRVVLDFAKRNGVNSADGEV